MNPSYEILSLDLEVQFLVGFLKTAVGFLSLWLQIVGRRLSVEGLELCSTLLLISSSLC